MQELLAVSRAGLKALAWGGSVALVFGVAVFWLPREYPELGFWESIYIALGLFLGSSGTPSFPTAWPLIAIHFLAPTIAVSAAGVAVSYLFKLSPALKTRLLSDHVVICGVGRLGKIIASSLLEQGTAAVGVDQGPAEAFEEWLSQKRLPMLFGDFANKRLLLRAGAARARSLVFVSGDDLANLEGAIGAYELLQTDRGPVRLIWAHLANEKLAQTARVAVRTAGRVGLRFFDTYRLAAERMVQRYFDRPARAGVVEIDILGFGKFGRDLFEILARDLGPDERVQIRVIDQADRDGQVRMLAEELGVAGRVAFLQSPIQELGLIEGDDHAYFLCTDDDLGNLTAAMQLAGRARGGHAHIYVRMARWPLKAMSARLGQDCGVVFVNINELVAEGVHDLPGVFAPPTEADLKRVDEKAKAV